MSREGPPVPPRATGMLLGIWMAVLLLIAFVVIPQLFASCGVQPQGGTGP